MELIMVLLYNRWNGEDIDSECIKTHDDWILMCFSHFLPHYHREKDIFLFALYLIKENM